MPFEYKLYVRTHFKDDRQTDLSLSLSLSLSITQLTSALLLNALIITHWCFKDIHTNSTQHSTEQACYRTLSYLQESPAPPTERNREPPPQSKGSQMGCVAAEAEHSFRRVTFRAILKQSHLSPMLLLRTRFPRDNTGAFVS